jgi:hypothetical protein
MENNNPRNLDGLTLRVVAGEGVVHRSPGTVMVLPSLRPDQVETANELLSMCASSADPTGRRLFRRVAGLLAEADPETVPALCLLVDTMDGLAVLVQGDVLVEVAGDADQRLSGSDSLAWAEGRITGEVKSIAVTADGRPSPPPASGIPFHLHSGTVPGAGITLVPDGFAPEPLQAPTVVRRPPDDTRPSPVVEAPPPPFASVSLLDNEEEQRPPLSVVGASADVTEVTDVDDTVDVPAAASLVEGALCSRGHFNDPDSPYCSVCGISMLQRTRDTVLRPRPSLGVLVVDDGSAYTVTTPYVIGREPESDESVARSEARPLMLDDEAHSVSRVHAHLTLAGWEVLLTDCGSSNGTYVSGVGKDGPWEALAPDVATRLEQRTYIRIGRRQLVFDSYRAPGPGR